MNSILQYIISGLLKKQVLNHKMYLLPVFLLLYSVCCVAQKRISLHGRVQNELGERLAGVTIRIKGQQSGTITDNKGTFLLTAQSSDSLEISYIGYQSRILAVGKQNQIHIVLYADKSSLNEVVVVGYGKQKKLTVTGAISSVSGEKLRESSSGNFTAALEGQISGLTATQAGGGQPGVDDAALYLRGAATPNGKSPLILIDGVPRDNLRTLDASEVESVTVLKDASSTAVFGVRGANGVILVTTKRGKPGETEFNASFDQSFSAFTVEPERLHSWEYIDLRNEASKNDGLPIPYSDAVREKFVNPLKGLDPNDPDYVFKKKVREYIYPDHDYYRELIRRLSPQSRLNVNASGGTEKIKFFINTSYLHQGGNLKVEPKSLLGYDPSVKLDRYSFRSNLDYNISNSLRAYLNLGTYIERVNMPDADAYPGSDSHWMMRDIYFEAQSVLPITPGPVTIGGFGVDPGLVVSPAYLDRSAFEVMNRMGYRKTTRSSLNSTVGLDWDLGSLITKGLSIKGMLSFDSYTDFTIQASKRERLFYANVNYETDELSYTVSRPDERRLSVARGTETRYRINAQGSLNYNRSFGLHRVTAMILAQRDYWEAYSGQIPFNVIGIAGRVTYGYDGRYLAEFNTGYNGSEQFAPSNRFGFFPSLSLGWVASNEKFFPENGVLTLIKFRGSWGEVGNDKIGGSRFLYQSNITVGGGPLGSLSRGKGINQGLLGNPNIQWEVAQKANIGLDLQFFGDLNLSVDVFKEHRTDILITRGTVPILQGVPLGDLPKVNMGIVNNKGLEIEYHYTKKLGNNWTVRSRGNIGFNKNKVEFIDEPKNDNSYAYAYRRTGYSLGQNWGYKIDYSNGNGYFNSQKELDEYLSRITYGFGNPRLGDFKYKDLNGDGEINEKDMAPIKYSSIPGITYGIGIGINYRNWGIDIFIQGLGHYSSYFQQQGVWETTKSGNYFGYQRHAWTEERYKNGEKITYPALGIAQNTNHVPNDFFIMNRAFTRLKNVQLSYKFNQEFFKRIGIKGMRVYIGGQNIATWTKFIMDHQDPEKSDPLGYPITKMYNLGINVRF